MSLNKVRSMEYMTQPVLSEGLVFGKCGMTDIDLSCDWQGKFFVFVELKHLSTGLTRGQQYHLEGLVKGLVKGDKQAVAILAKHDTPKGEPIMAQDAIVTSVYMGDQWEKFQTNTTLKEYMTLLHDAYQRSKA
jgi:hypothetical protein